MAWYALVSFIKRYSWQLYLIYLGFTGGLCGLVWTLGGPEIAIAGLLGASLLAMPAIYLVMLWRGRATLGRSARLWLWLKVLWYALLLVFVLVSVVGLSRWWQLLIGIPLLGLMVASRRIGRLATDGLRDGDSQTS